MRPANLCTVKNIILPGLASLSASYFGCPVQVTLRIEKITLHGASAAISPKDNLLIERSGIFGANGSGHRRQRRGEDALVDGSIPPKQTRLLPLVQSEIQDGCPRAQEFRAEP